MAEFKNTLNPAIWDKNNNLKSEVKAKLNQIAKAFIETLEIPTNAVEDIVITGSMASYNYTPHSDIDLHLVIDFDKVHTDCPIVGDYLLSKKSEFNQKHDIFIYGIPVEVYAEGVGQGTVHNGLYSLKTGWIDLPKKIKPTNNDVAVEAKYKEYKEAADSIKDGDLAEKLLDKIKKMRKAGLAEGGEFSVENLVFKKLRDTGVIEKLMKAKKEGVDKKLSLVGEAFESLNESVSEGCFEEIRNLVEEYINELRDKTLKDAKDMAFEISKAQEDEVEKVKKEADKEWTKDQAVKRKHQAAILDDKYENQVVNRHKKKYEVSKRTSKVENKVDNSSEK